MTAFELSDAEMLSVLSGVAVEALASLSKTGS